MSRTTFSLVTVLSVIVLLVSCSSMNRDNVVKSSGEMEQEWVTEGPSGSSGYAGVPGENGDASYYGAETGSGEDGGIPNILFDYDKYNIRKDARPVLESVASDLYENREQSIIIEGHTDERGTNDYNLALGEKRAKATMQYLRALGVSPARMTIMTFGEEKPVCTSQNETCWQRNRRALIR